MRRVREPDFKVGELVKMEISKGCSMPKGEINRVSEVSGGCVRFVEYGCEPFSAARFVTPTFMERTRYILNSVFAFFRLTRNTK
jgi:hypothetical protein